MTQSAGVPSSDYLAIALAIVLVALVGVSLSLTIPLLSLGMERMGITSTLNGLNTATAGIANLLIVPFVPRLAARFGVRVLLLGTILVGIVSTLLFPLLPFLLWFPLRFALGASLGALFVLSEYWINATAPPGRRGMVMGLYATVLALGFAAGPALLGLLGPEGWPPYVASAALFATALIPLGLAGGRTPEFEENENGGYNLFHFLRTAPSATLAALIFGAVETGTFALLPVYGTRTGLSEQEAAGLVSMIALGNVLFQIPVGFISDKIDRRKILFVCGLAGAIGAALIPAVAPSPIAFKFGLFIFGGIVGGLYTVGLAHLGQRYTGHDLASANAAFIMLYSVGLIDGPPLVGGGMDLIGPNGMAATLGLLLGIYAVVVLSRILTFGRS